MTNQVRLYQYRGDDGSVILVDRSMEGFVITTRSGDLRCVIQTIPFAEGDKLAICFRPGFDPIRDDVEEIIHAEEPPHPDD